ncbi:hypothetical protein Tco_0162228 [Tanacetum coccineum]
MEWTIHCNPVFPYGPVELSPNSGPNTQSECVIMRSTTFGGSTTIGSPGSPDCSPWNNEIQGSINGKKSTKFGLKGWYYPAIDIAKHRSVGSQPDKPTSNSAGIESRNMLIARGHDNSSMGDLWYETDIQEKDKNKAKNDKTEHENEKSLKKSQSQSHQSQLREAESEEYKLEGPKLPNP